MENIPEPTERPPRWMNDNDMKQVLTLKGVGTATDGIVELCFTTSIGEELRRTCKTSSPEYAFIYNGIRSGKKSFIYEKKNGFRVPASYA